MAAPTNTPVRLPRTDAGSMPARSNASHVASSSSRCCGSMVSASRGEMSNSSGSNRLASATNPPLRVEMRPGVPGSGAYSPSRSQPRSAGNGEIASPPSATRDHRSSGEATEPG
ncbi:hypothetical protein H480_32483 [Amycolatopsis vancoresmycina DSM 44592]|uniref:Uncharacterized protein n=1 Tax=Amycolatopsis vancoresmycina DSM 44592 TaxID=1292037 RepID=R1FY76_9PSEU|nr:hypothetical protein H480_32483 [Amycolatopsis vancoresmycina DSM 44592]